MIEMEMLMGRAMPDGQKSRHTQQLLGRENSQGPREESLQNSDHGKKASSVSHEDGWPRLPDRESSLGKAVSCGH